MMTKARYMAMKTWFEERPRCLSLLRLLASLLTKLVYILYGLGILYLFYGDRSALPRFMGVPLAVFISGSLIRRSINAPRPYEVFETAPLLPKDTRGRSFPSRHVFSSAAIAAAFAGVNPVVGLGMALVCLLIALTRVLGGVHWPKDVLAGLVYGGLLGLLGLYL